jgi:hypothetical protein
MGIWIRLAETSNGRRDVLVSTSQIAMVSLEDSGRVLRLDLSSGSTVQAIDWDLRILLAFDDAASPPLLSGERGELILLERLAKLEARGQSGGDEAVYLRRALADISEARQGAGGGEPPAVAPGDASTDD